MDSALRHEWNKADMPESCPKADAPASPGLLIGLEWCKPAAAAAAVPSLAAGGLAVWCWLAGRMNPRPIVRWLCKVPRPSRRVLGSA